MMDEGEMRSEKSVYVSFIKGTSFQGIQRAKKWKADLCLFLTVSLPRN